MKFLCFFVSFGVAVTHDNTVSSKECPAGYVLNGKVCELVEVLAAEPTCPHGSELAGRDCVSFANFRKVCPTGYATHGNECRKTITEAATAYCDEGRPIESLGGYKCEVFVQASPYCPSGYRRVGDECQQEQGISRRCPKGFVPDHDQCSRTVKSEASRACPDGYDLSPNGHKCIGFVIPPSKCPSGFSPSPDQSQCLKFHPKILTNCPLSFKEVGNKCEATHTEPPTYQCSEDMEFDISTKSCLKEVIPAPICPYGYDLIGNECEKHRLADKVCHHGTLKDGVCESLVSFEKHAVCPQSFTLVGKMCKKVEDTEHITKCAVGQLKGNECITYTQAAPQYTCPDGYDLVKTGGGPECARTISYDCSTVTTERECEMPDVSHSQQIRKMIGVDYKQKEAFEHHPKAPVCRQIQVSVPKTCKRQEVVSPTLTCGDGKLVGKHCEVISSSEPIRACPHGYDVDSKTGHCSRYSSTSPLWKCSRGYDAGSVCHEIEKTEADYVCPEGTQLENIEGKMVCVDRKPQIHKEAKVIKSPATLTCSSGSLKGSVCVNIEQTIRALVCPSFAEEVEGVDAAGRITSSTRCATFAEKVVPPTLEMEAPVKYICDDGRITATKHCYSKTFTEFETFCPNGTAQSGSVCVSTAALVYPPPTATSVPAKYVCDNGSKLAGVQCFRNEEVAPLLECPHGFTEYLQDGKDCYTTRSASWACPPGTLKDHDRCLKKTHVPPTVTIVRTCTKGEPGCH